MTGALFMDFILLQKMKPHQQTKVTLFPRHYTSTLPGVAPLDPAFGGTDVPKRTSPLAAVL
jgi:hypothetical protein